VASQNDDHRTFVSQHSPVQYLWPPIMTTPRVWLSAVIRAVLVAPIMTITERLLVSSRLCSTCGAHYDDHRACCSQQSPVQYLWPPIMTTPRVWLSAVARTVLVAHIMTTTARVHVVVTEVNLVQYSIHSVVNSFLTKYIERLGECSNCMNRWGSHPCSHCDIGLCTQLSIV
jgi:hypothetical protein